jgi:hypothetical protein
VLTVQTNNGSLQQATVTSELARQGVVELFRKNNVPIEFKVLRPGALASVLNWTIPLLTLFLLGFVGWRAYCSMSGRDGSFNCTDASNKQTVTFADVAGVDEAKSELAETIEFLRDPSRFGRLGGRAPRGILLAGSPGTGKTMKLPYHFFQSPEPASRKSLLVWVPPGFGVFLRRRGKCHLALYSSTRLMPWVVAGVAAEIPPQQTKIRL